MADIDEMIKEMRKQGGQSKESDFVKIFEYFVSKDGIMGKTKITAKQRNMLYVYGLMHKKHPKWGLENAAQDLAHLFISQDGESRHAMVELFRGLLSQMRQESVNLEVPRDGKTPPNGR